MAAMRINTFLSSPHLMAPHQRLSPRYHYQSKKIGDYVYCPSDRIGKGYSSSVYRGKNTNTGELVAIKVIEHKKNESVMAQTLMKREIEALKALKHPNILRAYEVFSTLNNTYIVTECCQTDLAEILKKKGCLREPEALKYFYEIICGYQHMRSKGFIHRDFKPANILLKDNIAKIADLGFSRIIREESIQEEYNVGSPLFMSPEALKNNIYSEKSDVWALGVMLYELINGKAPFSGDSEQDLLKDMLTRSFKKEDLRASQKTREILRRCLTVDEKKRCSLDQLLELFSNQDPDLRLHIPGAIVPNNGPFSSRSPNHATSPTRPINIDRQHGRMLSLKPSQPVISETQIPQRERQFTRLDTPTADESLNRPKVPSIHQKVPKQESALAKIDKVLFNELHYVIYLINLSDILGESIQRCSHGLLPVPDATLLPMLKYIIDLNCKVRIKKLTKVLPKSNEPNTYYNVYHMADWKDFVKHHNFKTYLTTIAKFEEQHLKGGEKLKTPPGADNRFIKQIAVTSDNYQYPETESLILNYQFYLRKTLKMFNQSDMLAKITKDGLDKVAEDNIILIDLLLSAFQLNAQHISHYSDPYQFACESYLQVIVNGKMEVTEQAIPQIATKLKYYVSS